MFVSEIYDELVEILATADRSKVFRKLTQALQVLMESGHYFHTNKEVDACTGWDGQTVTLPRGVEVPLAVNVDGSPTYFRGRLFQYSVNKGGMYAPVSWAWDDRGFVSTAMDIRQPSQLVAVAEHAADASLAIRVIGTDGQNRPLRTQTADGVGVDGAFIPIHAIGDFPFGTIAPDPVSIQTRTVKVTPLTQFEAVNNENHQYQTGQGVSVTKYTPFSVLPPPIQQGEKFYVGATSNNTLQLYRNEIDALAGNNQVRLQSVVQVTPGDVVLTDQRGIQLYTTVALTTEPQIALDSPNEVTFATFAGGSSYLPVPLLANTTYFAAILDATNLLIYDNATAAAAVDDTYIPLSVSSGQFYAYLRKPITPQTKLTFTIEPQFASGDSVQCYTNNGVLPQPLLKGQAYYVHRIPNDTTTFACTLHLNYAESISGDNPINLITNGSGLNSIAKLLPATAYPGTRSNISAPGLSLPTSVSGSGAIVTPLVTGPVTSATMSAYGSSYTSPPSVSFSDLGGYNYASVPAISLVGDTGAGAAFTVTVTGAPNGYISNIAVNSGGSNYSAASPPVVNFIGGLSSGGFPAKAHVVIANGAITSIILDAYGSGASATSVLNSGSSTIQGILLTNPGNGYLYPPRITLNGGGGSGAAATCAVTTSFISGYRVDAPGAGYTKTPAIFITGGTGSGAAATASINQSGGVATVTPITQGTGYSTPPTVTVVPSTGIYVQFSTTGILPAPLAQGVAYRAELPTSQDGSFTVKNADFSDIQILSAGSGTFYVALSRTFGIGFTNIWEADFNGVPDGQPVYFGSDYLLPITSPSTGAGVPYYVQRISSTQAKLYTGFTPGSPGTFTGLISITGLGAGQSYYAIRSTCAPAVYQNLLAPYDTKYLQDGTLVSFTASQPNGILPEPLVAENKYSITKNGTKITLSNASFNTDQVVFTSLGTGQLYMNMVHRMTPKYSTTLDVDNSLFETGESVIFRPADGDIIPFELTGYPTTYYARRSTNSKIELYLSRAYATNTASIDGRVGLYTTGNSVDSYFYADSIQDPVLVKAILHIEKPPTAGYVSLYAFDYGRSNDMTLIGQYHPSETNPKYRRIRLGKQCSWVRIMYRVSAPTILTLDDYIPIEHSRAIIAAVHAVDLEDKDFMEQAGKYWASAISHLKAQNESMEGHAMTPPQINNITYGDGTDIVMF